MRLAILDGNQNLIAHTAVSLRESDLDEVNICRTLELAKEGNIIATVPEAGSIVGIVLPELGGPTPFEGRAGVSAWVKNVLGKFFTNVNEPFEGRVTAIAKARCERMPPSVASLSEVAARLGLLFPNFNPIPAVCVEDTGTDSGACID